ncbi:hypothetical protein NCS57_00968900 [Fusarium keratoplasticum]|uniref:Uncharacterized protein n=1 Tax=Fusarium keratoplasticum TaxID=1328300 RepID=A0ACC0QTS8_9HYPO|nr:hypothetical protein NCS57_00968900 [Fusarium keratoplasticum]KAI8663673.1 hypothetical protein NCS57_00968900 [Fusarium keratoplasticum]KAI8664318.1 hypothetical protein NCS55_00940000 [Fusarium keratoplasticum]
MARFSFSSILKGFYHAWQFIFTVILILIWIVAWLVQAGSIDMPEWTKDLRDQDEEDWKVLWVLGVKSSLLIILMMEW